MLVAHDEGYWNFSCGQNDHGGVEDFHNVGIGHLSSHDPSINACADMQDGYVAERQDQDHPWVKVALLPGSR